MLLGGEIRIPLKDATLYVKNMSGKLENMKTLEHMKLLLHREFTKKLTSCAPFHIDGAEF
jgi:hypothetical protein